MNPQVGGAAPKAPGIYRIPARMTERGGRSLGLRSFRLLSRRSGCVPAVVAVGMPVTRHPPHRSPRANCPHEAPTLDEWRRTVRVERDGARAEPESSAGQVVGTGPRS